MQIRIGSTQKVKVGSNEVEVKVVAKTDKGWLVETSAGRAFPVNNKDRFIESPENTAESTESPAEPPQGEEKKLSMLQAAIEVLKRNGGPMNSKEIIEAMKEASLWESKSGKTPHNTLHSALSKELKKGNAPFKKAEERGKFQIL